MAYETPAADFRAPVNRASIRRVGGIKCDRVDGDVVRFTGAVRRRKHSLSRRPWSIGPRVVWGKRSRTGSAGGAGLAGASAHGWLPAQTRATVVGPNRSSQGIPF